MTSVTVACRVGVVLEEVDLASDAFFFQTLFGRLDKRFEDPFAGFVVGNDVFKLVALGSGVLGMTADVQVQPGTVLEEDVGGPSPRHNPTEQIAGYFVRAEASLSAQRASDAVFVFESKDAPIHIGSLSVSRC